MGYSKEMAQAIEDMIAMIKAILLHPEARESVLSYDPNHGKLREPIVRLMHLSRAFKLLPENL